MGSTSSVDVFFQWRETGASTWTATATETLSATGTFSETVSSLASETEYEFRAAGEYGGIDPATGSTETFLTTAEYTYVSGDAHGEGRGAFTGAARAENGNIIFAPAHSENVGILEID